MIAWIIIVIVLLLLLTLPVGVDAAYAAPDSFLKLKIGPFRKSVLPRAEGKRRRPGPKKDKEKPAESDSEPKEKKTLGLTLDDILSLADTALRALHRFRMHLSVDLFQLHWTAASDDPYRAVLQYGRVNEALGFLGSAARSAVTVRDVDVRTALDLERTKPEIAARIVLSVQIWEILFIALCAGGSGLRWYIKKKRTVRAAAVGSAGKEQI